MYKCLTVKKKFLVSRYMSVSGLLQEKKSFGEKNLTYDHVMRFTGDNQR